MSDLNGVLVVDKPLGWTSAGVVARVKRVLGAKRTGHTGTLDPLASGVLPIVVGEATKLAAFLIAEDKEYEGELELGITTDTLDAEGVVVSRLAVEEVKEAHVRLAMKSLLGTTSQTPPAHSAIKVNGRRLYELARRGVEQTLPLREVRVDVFELCSWAPPRVRFRVACKKGTYVRALVRDVGTAVGCGATLTELRRTRSGKFHISQAESVDSSRERFAARLIAPADAVSHLPTVHLDDTAARFVACGRPLEASSLGIEHAHGTVFRLLTPRGELAALAKEEQGKLSYLRVFGGVFGESVPGGVFEESVRESARCGVRDQVKLAATQG